MENTFKIILVTVYLILMTGCTGSESHDLGLFYADQAPVIWCAAALLS